MRVAMYYPWIYLKGGIERTMLELATRSRHQWTVFTSHYRPEETFPEFRDVAVRHLGSVSVRRDVLSVGKACLRLLLQPQDWSGYDALMISCDGIGNLLALRAGGVPLLCLCHTPLKIAYDPHARARWRQIFRPNLLSRAGVALFTRVDRLVWRRYRRIFCVSNEVRRRLLAAGVVAPEQTEVLHPGVDLDRLVPTGRREPFFLLPGRIMWSKNVELGLRAFLEFKSRSMNDELQGMRLVVAGMVDEKSRWYLSYLRELAAGREDVEFVVCPSDEVLFELYDRCFAVLFTPPNEDWGMVPLEAMAFAKPVIAVNRGGPAESIADRVSGFLCHDEPSAFAAVMRELATDAALYSRISLAARQRVEGWHWRRFVDRIDDYIDELRVPATSEHSLIV